MSNTLYPTGREAFARGDIDWETDDFIVVLGDNTYTYSAAHEFATDLTGILGTPMAMTGNAILTDGVCDSDDLSYAGVGIGETVTWVGIYKDTGVAATSPLIYFADTNNDTTPISRAGNGSDIPLVWSSSSSRVFKL